MRQRYTTAILHLSSFVERRKQLLLVKHSWRSFFDVAVLVVAETLLAIVSIPLVISTYRASGSGAPGTSGIPQRFALRRMLTRGMVGIVVVLWVVKIGILVVREYVDQRIIHVQQTESDQTFTTPKIAAAVIDPALLAPSISGIGGSEQYGWVTNGTAPANTTVALYVTRTDGKDTSIKVYLADADAAGTFAIHEDADRFRLESGEYAMQAFTYNALADVKSVGSNIVTGVARESRFAFVLSHADRTINILVSLVLAFGIGMTLLLF